MASMLTWVQMLRVVVEVHILCSQRKRVVVRVVKNRVDAEVDRKIWSSVVMYTPPVEDKWVRPFRVVTVL